MKYVEFIVFLCRIAHEHYETTPHRGELLYIKLDHLIPNFLGFVNLDPIFQFNEKFEAEAKLEFKHLRKKQKKLEQLQKEAAAKGEQVDPKLVVEVKEMEKQMRLTGNSFLSGKSKLSKKGESSDSSEDGKSKRSKL